MPLEVARRLDAVLPGTNPLSPPPTSETSDGLSHGTLARELVGQEFGAWSMGVASLNLLQDEISRRRPSLMVEFGSGVSSVCLARYLLDALGQDAGVCLVSFEQDPDQTQRTRALLRSHGLETLARVETARLVAQDAMGVPFQSYDPEVVDCALQGGSPDLVLIDGPSGPPGIRFGSLLCITPFLSKETTFILDDAFRSAELEVARRWSGLPNVVVDGLVFVDHGLMFGRVRPLGAEVSR